MIEPRVMNDALKPTADPAWVLEAVGYDPLREGSLKSRFCDQQWFLRNKGCAGHHPWSALGRATAHLCRRVV